jgi:two-component system, LytTR family, response regulator
LIKALIIDDEPSAINTLRLMLDRYVPEITELDFTNNPNEGLQRIKKDPPQLLFLDIQMHTMTGFDLLKQIQPINFDIIFTTAHDQYALQAICFSALDYLLKPIDANELREAVNKFLSKEERLKSKALRYANLLHNIDSTEKKDFKLAINTTEGTDFYRTNEIIRLEGESNYTKIYFLNNKKVLASKTLKEYDELLSDHGFIRTHKSHVINKQHVVSYLSDGFLTMIDQSKVEISRRRQHEIKAILKNG